MGKSGGGGSAGFMQSPQQQQLFGAEWPLVQAQAQFGRQNIPQPLGFRYIDPQTNQWSTPASYASPDAPRRTTPPMMTIQGIPSGTPPAINKWDYTTTLPMDTAQGLIDLGLARGGKLQADYPPFNQTGVTTGGATGPGGIAGAQGGAPMDLPLEYFSPFQPGLWPLPTYNVPNPEFMMPTARTMGSISPDVLAGVMKPYQNVEQQLMETLGAGGALGSARGGFSGQGAAGLGKYWAEAAPTIGQQMWSMIRDPLATAYGAELQKRQALWGEALQQFKYPWQAAPSFVSMSMPNPVVQEPSPSPLAGLGSLLKGIGSIGALL